MRVEYDFLRVGSVVEPRRSHIYVDVGNQSLPGVIDTHTIDAHLDAFECSSSLIVSDPSLVTGWISGEDLRLPIKVVMHENPDYDCIASSLLVRKLLEAQAVGKVLPDGWHEWAPVVADSARRIDRGETRLRLPIKNEQVPITPYLSMMALHDHVAREGLVPKDSWRRLVEDGQAILERAVRLAVERNISHLELVDLRGSLAEFGDLESIIDQKVKAFERDARRIRLDSVSDHRAGQLEGVFRFRLPFRASPCDTVPAAVACIRDPDCGAGFFKSVVRGAYADTVQATCVFLTVPPDPLAGTRKWVRPIISVDPDSPFDLRGLGRQLDRIETDERKMLGQEREGRPRPGFDNSDPWYDGRAAGYTIVDAPRWSTVLPPERVLAELLDVGAWLSVRVSEVMGTMLSTIALARRGSGSSTYDAISSAIAFWHSQDRDPRTQRLYVEYVDAVSCLAAAGDVAGEWLATCGEDVLLGLLANGDPNVRVRALLAAAQRGEPFVSYAEECKREDVLPLLKIVTGEAADAAGRLIIGGAVRAEHALLFDAVAARLRRAGASDVTLNAAVALAGRAIGVHEAGRSIVRLWSTIREIEPRRAAALDTIAASIVGAALRELATSPAAKEITGDALRDGVCGARQELERRAAEAEGVERAIAQLLLGFESIELVAPWQKRLEQGDNGGELGGWLAEGRVAHAAQMLLLLLESGGAAALAPERRGVVLTMAGALLERAGENEAVAPLIRALMPRLRAAFGVDRMIAAFGEPTAMLALRCSPEFAGALVRTAPLDHVSRRALVATAVAGSWGTAIAGARSFVLTPQDDPTYRNVLALARAAAAARRFDGPVPAAQAKRVTLLLAAASASRRAAPSSIDTLAAVAAAGDLQTAADQVGAARALIADELRHAAPDHHLLADAEPSLAKAETLARALKLLSAAETPAEQVVLPILRFALALPELDQSCVRELIRLRCTQDPREERDSAWMKCAFDFAAAVDAITPGGRLVTDVERIRSACLSIATIARSCPGESHGWLVQTALRDTEAVLNAYASGLDRAGSKEAPLLAAEILRASALAKVVSDFPEVAGAGKGTAAITALARVAQASDDRAPGVLSRLRRSLGRAASAGDAYVAAARTLPETEAAEPAGDAVNVLYGRLRQLLQMPLPAYDTVYARIVHADLTRYDIATARKRIEEYSFRRLAALLGFWMSPWTLVIPIGFVALFVAAGQHLRVGHVVEAAVWVLLAMVVASIGLEWRRRRQSAKDGPVDALRYELFLPHFGIPVLIGVYTAAMSHEMSAHLALQLGDGHYAALGVGLFATAAWALRQMIRQDPSGQKASKLDVLMIAARLFAYGFVVAVILNLVLSPLLTYQKGLHDLFIGWMDMHHEHTLIPHVLTMPLLSSNVPLFPRHIVLDALFGMFIGIVLHRFLKSGGEE